MKIVFIPDEKFRELTNKVAPANQIPNLPLFYFRHVDALIAPCGSNYSIQALTDESFAQDKPPTLAMLATIIMSEEDATRPMAVPLDPSITHLQRGDMLSIKNGIAKLK